MSTSRARCCGSGSTANDLQALEFPVVLDQIAAHATCQPGADAVRALAPLPTLELAQREQALVESAGAVLAAAESLDLSGVSDVASVVGRAAKGSPLGGVELREIVDAERALAEVCATIRKVRAGAGGRAAGPQSAGPAGRQSDPLLELAGRRQSSEAIVRRIEDAVDPGGRVVDGASAELAQIRKRQRTLHDRVREQCATLVRKPETAKLLSEPVVTVRAGRYVVPVRAEFAPQFSGVVHDQSASGATLYVEPMATVQANNDLRALAVAEEREVAKLLAALSAAVGAADEALLANAALARELDCVGARARWARKVDALRPALADEPLLRIVAGRHPLLRREAVPIDVEIGESFDALVISGPNMGGKTVTLKTMGLFALLAYAGVPLPAAPGTRAGRFDHVACVVGDDQSIAQNLSSFSAHLQALHAALAAAGARSLLLVDEIGGGTEPGSGAALAQAIIEAALARGARIVVTTHYSELKSFAAARDRAQNASMLFDPKTNEPTYALVLGVPGQSLAFPLAAALGFDDELVKRAQALLGVEARALETAIANLAAERERMRAVQAELERERGQARILEGKLLAQAHAMEQERAQFERKAREELELALQRVRDELRAEFDRGRQDSLRQRPKALRKGEATIEATLTDMRRSLGLEEGGAGSPPPRFAVGDRIIVKSLERPGVVREIYDRDVLVETGSFKMVIAPSDLRLETKTAQQAPKHSASVPEAAGATTSVDVRGMRVDEAWHIVDKALDDAVLAGLDVLRIVHGKGTGQLGKGLRSFLKDHPQVDDATFAPDREGGTGVTVVRLR